MYLDIQGLEQNNTNSQSTHHLPGSLLVVFTSHHHLMDCGRINLFCPEKAPLQYPGSGSGHRSLGAQNWSFCWFLLHCKRSRISTWGARSWGRSYSLSPMPPKHCSQMFPAGNPSGCRKYSFCSHGAHMHRCVLRPF
jgi:hypothetical protein